ncbi:MAG TPA: nucleoside hydrolase [Telluria sp.]
MTGPRPVHTKRRRLLAGLVALPAALPLASALARPSGLIAQAPSARVIVDNDFAGDPDGLVALAHQLLSPKTRTVLVTSSALDPGLAGMAGQNPATTAASGARRAQELLRRLGRRPFPAVVAGAERFDAGADESNLAARAIVAQALRDDPLPLVLACGGPLTNVAAALRLRPEIAAHMSLVWIGGSAASEGGAEYNLMTDLAAARFVFEETRLPILQIPLEEYRRFQVSVAELDDGFRTISPVSQWLYDQYRQLPPFVKLGGTLTFGDSPLVSATAFDPAACPVTVREARHLLDDGRYGAPIAGRQVRLAHSLDPRLNFADFLALLRAQARGAA